MRRFFIPVFLCIILFLLPLQVFIIGDYSGIGIQGAVYRYQTSGYGTSFILITRELGFVFDGIYTGRTALSVILWALGTALLTWTTVFSLIHADKLYDRLYRQVLYGIILSGIIYLASCMAQYGFFFKGPAGISLPLGIIFMFGWITCIHYFTKNQMGDD